MSKAKSTPRRQPSTATREDPGDVISFKAKVIHHDQEARSRSREETFIIAAQQLLEAKVPEDFIIVRGILDLGGSFPTEEAILTAVRKPENVPKEPEDPPPLKKPRKTSKELDDEPTDLTEAILNEESRRTITVSTDHLRTLYKPLWMNIRYPIERCIGHMNADLRSNPRLQWTDRQLRDPNTCTLLFTHPVPEEEQHMVQIRHIDFFGCQRKCLSCHVGISNGIRLQIYDQHTSQWLEITYGRGDILLVRGHKFHRGTNHSEPTPKIRLFLYIEDEAYAKELRDRGHAEKGAVFSAGIKNLDAWYKREAKLEAQSIGAAAKETKDSKKASKLKKMEGLRNWWNQPATSTTETTQDPIPVDLNPTLI